MKIPWMVIAITGVVGGTALAQNSFQTATVEQVVTSPYSFRGKLIKLLIPQDRSGQVQEIREGVYQAKFYWREQFLSCEVTRQELGAMNLRSFVFARVSENSAAGHVTIIPIGNDILTDNLHPERARIIWARGYEK